MRRHDDSDESRDSERQEAYVAPMVEERTPLTGLLSGCGHSGTF
jgi:hypothetical protein